MTCPFPLSLYITLYSLPRCFTSELVYSFLCTDICVATFLVLVCVSCLRSDAALLFTLVLLCWNVIDIPCAIKLVYCFALIDTTRVVLLVNIPVVLCCARTHPHIFSSCMHLF